MKEFDPKELLEFDGKEDRPAYVVHQGKVIDVSESRLWKDGLHMTRHHAGNDLTTDIRAAPHSPEVLDRFPQVGILRKEEVPQISIPKPLAGLLARFPFLRRHPHPMMVHFPLVFSVSTALFNLLYLLTGVNAFEVTALHCLGGGILFTPIAILTGWYTWWLNYMAKPLRPVTIKTRLSLILMAVQVGAFVWRIADPDILVSFQGKSIIYLVLVLSLIPLVTIIGWFGAQMTFPIEEG
jgi:predicted heme/steroid binding protein/uncharacterized membrane protein